MTRPLASSLQEWRKGEGGGEEEQEKRGESGWKSSLSLEEEEETIVKRDSQLRGARQDESAHVRAADVPVGSQQREDLVGRIGEDEVASGVELKQQVMSRVPRAKPQVNDLHGPPHGMAWHSTA